jgi:hydroxymethylglutaryl-CoA reductase
MSLHARNVAIAAGATGPQIGRIATELIARGTVREDVAREILANG